MSNIKYLLAIILLTLTFAANAKTSLTIDKALLEVFEDNTISYKIKALEGSKLFKGDNINIHIENNKRSYEISTAKSDKYKYENGRVIITDIAGEKDKQGKGVSEIKINIKIYNDGNKINKDETIKLSHIFNNEIFGEMNIIIKDTPATVFTFPTKQIQLEKSKKQYTIDFSGKKLNKGDEINILSNQANKISLTTPEEDKNKYTLKDNKLTINSDLIDKLSIQVTPNKNNYNNEDLTINLSHFYQHRMVGNVQLALNKNTLPCTTLALDQLTPCFNFYIGMNGTFNDEYTRKHTRIL